VGPGADEALTANKTTAETMSNGFNMAASSVAGVEYRQLAAE
jgi:hypothetical protein